ncbi:adenylate/guanylate cyclase domain-containing protein [Pseudanabaena sp. UWO310]|uniref:adenylate/guanylate cyclase domain-containing protein n=1 Tax=Pseudanabaena sp. UWO310 TaxID=2480795 RepID=UPI0011586B81|nr:adenylate/guanylate cyclase domain-containing protein [Pseudanabaena sp. UWO310]TYQ30068.1 adenylate/guanylate cyclase domain-containing protein [Pseudanabaena sp. UWO310]
MLEIFNVSRHHTNSAIAKAVKSLSQYGISSVVQERFIDFLQNQDERFLFHVNPHLIADRLQLSEREALNLLVVALKEGIVSLNWDIQCPQCLRVDLALGKLGDIRTTHTCPCLDCRHTHESDADRQVRVAFSIDNRLRSLSPEANDPTFRDRIDAHYGVVSGHRLLTLQMFRELFPRETIPPNESLLIRQVTILFTDLAGSTALYNEKGDPQAYSLVRQHFNFLFTIVDEHNGAVIKTIGDAIMATFTSSDDGLKAAIAMQAKMRDFNRSFESENQQLILKVGVHTGPCICVNLNDRSDYFGTTVNTAARVQGLSKGNDIVLTVSSRSQSFAIEDIDGYFYEESSVILKGLSEPISVLRMSAK